MQNAPMYDVDAEEAALKRQLAIAEAMQLQSMAQPGGTETAAGGVAVKKSPLDAIAKIAQAYFGQKQIQNLDDKQRQLGERNRQDMRSELERYFTNIEGGSATIPGGGNSDAYGGQIDYKPDPRKAVLEAMTSRHPGMQQIGAAQMKSLTPAQMTPQDYLKLPGFDARSRIAAAQGGGVGALSPEKKPPLAVGGMLLDPDTMTVLQTNGPVPQQVRIAGDLYEINPTTKQYKKLDNAPKVTVNNNIPKGESEFDKAFGGAEGKRISAALEARPAQIDGLEAIANGKELLRQGIHTGITANLSKDVDKVWGKLSATEPEKAARTEQFVSYIGDVVVPRLKDFGGSDTVEELKYLQKVLAGDITMEASALNRVLQSAEHKMRRKIQATDDTVKAYREKGYRIPSVEPGVQAPPMAPGAPAPGVPTVPAKPGGVLTLEQYIKSRQGVK